VERANEDDEQWRGLAASARLNLVKSMVAASGCSGEGSRLTKRTAADEWQPAAALWKGQQASEARQGMTVAAS
jgi:hypothetical protein